METQVEYGETIYPSSWLDVNDRLRTPEVDSREERREEVIKSAVRFRTALLMAPGPERATALNEGEDELSKAVDVMTAWEPDDVPAFGADVPEW